MGEIIPPLPEPDPKSAAYFLKPYRAILYVILALTGLGLVFDWFCLRGL